MRKIVRVREDFKLKVEGSGGELELTEKEIKHEMSSHVGNISLLDTKTLTQLNIFSRGVSNQYFLLSFVP